MKLKTKKELFTSLRDAARDIENKATIGLHKRQTGDANGAHADLNASITELRALPRLHAPLFARAFDG